MIKKLPYVSDRVGIIASVVCLVHCLIFPVLVILRIPLSEWLHEFWHSLEYIFLAISFVAVFFSARSTVKPWMRYFLWTSFFALAASILLKHYEAVFDTVAIAAALILITAHILNIRQLSCQVR